ncbi:hypothetical protein [Streptomyces sp. NPDC052107]|uniref:hypothetical protein n=1 Tax=Streptomyces sp. NPDC052107 TaxID=3155632 RepID=UPI00343F9558
MAIVGTPPTQLGQTPTCLVLAHDDRRLYVGGSGGLVSVLDTKTHQVVSTFPSLSVADLAVDLSGDHLYVAGVTSDRQEPLLTEVDVRTQTVTRSASLESWPNRLVLTPDGRRLYLTLPDVKAVAVLDTGLWKVIRTLSATVLPAALAVSCDGRQVYVCDAFSVQVIDTATDTWKAPIALDCPVSSLVVTPDGGSLLATSPGRVLVVDTASGRTEATLGTVGTGSDVTLSADGTRAHVAGGASASVTVIDTARREVIRDLSVPGRPDRLVVLRHGHRGYALDADASTVVPFLTRTVVVPAGSSPEAVAATPDGRFVCTANSGGATVSVIDSMDRHLPMGPGAYDVAVTPDGGRAFVSVIGPQSCPVAGTLSCIETASGRVIREQMLAGATGDLTVSGAGRLYVTGPDTVTALDITSFEAVARRRTHGFGLRTAVSPDGTRLYVLSVDPATATTSVTTLDARTLAEVHPPVESGKEPDFPDPVGLAVAAEGRRVLVSGSPDVVSVLDMTTFQLVATLPVEGGPGDLVATADGRLVYVVCRDAGTVSIVDAIGLTALGQPFHVGPTPIGAALDEGAGRLYVVCADPGTLVVLDSRTGAEVERFTVGLGANAVSLTPDGRYAYVAWARMLMNPDGSDASDGALWAFDTHTTRIPVGTHPGGLAISPTRQCLYVAESDAGTISVFELASRTPVGGPVRVGGRPRGLVLSHDERRLYAADADGAVRVVDTTSAPPTLLATILVGGTPASLAMPRDDSRVYVADSSEGNLTVPVALATATSDVCVAPDGGRVYVADAGADAVLVVDAATLSVTGRIELHATPHMLSLTQDGRRLLVTLPAAGTLAQLDTATSALLDDPIPVGNVPHAVTVAADGRIAYVTNVGSGTLALVDL